MRWVGNGFSRTVPFERFVSHGNTTGYTPELCFGVFAYLARIIHVEPDLIQCVLMATAV